MGGAALVTVVLWASAFAGIRAAGEDLSPGALSLARLTVDSAALGALVLLRRAGHPAEGYHFRGARDEHLDLLRGGYGRIVTPRQRGARMERVRRSPGLHGRVAHEWQVLGDADDPLRGGIGDPVPVGKEARSALERPSHLEDLPWARTFRGCPPFPIHLSMEIHLHLWSLSKTHPLADSSRCLARYVLSGRPLESGTS